MGDGVGMYLLLPVGSEDGGRIGESNNTAAGPGYRGGGTRGCSRLWCHWLGTLRGLFVVGLFGVASPFRGFLRVCAGGYWW